MISKGDKIVYPNHGAGTIVSVETKEILGEEKKYFIMKLPIGEMKVMIPVEKVDEIGIRNIIDSDEADDVINLLRITATIKIIFDMIIIFLLFLIVMLLYKILGVVVIQ